MADPQSGRMTYLHVCQSTFERCNGECFKGMEYFVQHQPNWSHPPEFGTESHISLFPFLVGGPDSTFDPVCVFVCLSASVQQIFVRQILNASLCWTNQTSTSANLLLSVLWLGIAASNSVTRKTTRLAFVTYNLTSSKLQSQKMISIITWW